MKPRKFFYEEIAYFGNTYLIEFIEGRLKLQKSQVGTIVISNFDIYAEPTIDKWKEFYFSVKNLHLEPKEPDENIMDGFQVKCHITFRKVLIKFEIINPRFKNFKKFQALVNSLTICNEYPKGVLNEDC